MTRLILPNQEQTSFFLIKKIERFSETIKSNHLKNERRRSVVINNGKKKKK